MAPAAHVHTVLTECTGEIVYGFCYSKCKEPSTKLTLAFVDVKWYEFHVGVKWFFLMFFMTRVELNWVTTFELVILIEFDGSLTIIMTEII